MKFRLPFALLLASTLFAAGKPPEQVLAEYVAAIGGAAALDRIQTREVHAHQGHNKVVYYWQKPNKVLLVDGKKKIGYDGASGWMLSTKKRVSRLPKGEEKSLLMDADPLRYAHLKQLYPDLAAANPEKLDDRPMDVLVAPNDRGQTKFYFDAASHLLVHIEDFGETSAYFKHETDFEDYREQDGLKQPFRIIHDSNEPGAHTEQVRISKIIENVPLEARIFVRPSGSNVTLGGKR
jgi:hypothetical protein